MNNCCKESTHTVDGSPLWRLTLDEDLFCTLRLRFPSWFDSNNSAISKNSDKNIVHTVAEKLVDVTNEMAEGNPCDTNSIPIISLDNITTNGFMDSRESPPKAIVDATPLQAAMDKNKESLKVKLMVRRPITQLVEQGIIPSLKSSPALHEQRKQLERARTGDLLKAKIQQRPKRQELVLRHILEHDEGLVDPSLAEKQRMLKKARLADQLNTQLSHRPGPLELIKKNILHTEEPIERIVKEGLVSFKATSEGLLNRPQHPNGYITFEDDSLSSEGDHRNSPIKQDSFESPSTISGIVSVATGSGALSPANMATIYVTSTPILDKPTISALTAPYVPIQTISAVPIVATTAPSLPPPPPPLPPPPPTTIKLVETYQIKPETSNLFAELCQSVVGNSSIIPFMPSPLPLNMTGTSSSSSGSMTIKVSSSPLSSVSNSNKSDAPGKDKNRKKGKIKPVTKARTIKFHEYKGPPSAQKNGLSSSMADGETSYQILLKQQTCLLEFIEGFNKNPALQSPSSQRQQTQPEITKFSQNSNNFMQKMPSASLPSPAQSQPDSSTLDLAKLEKLKVSDLKVLLKKRNLPVSGPKPTLIDRLRPFLPLETDSVVLIESSSGETCDLESLNSPRALLSPESDTDNMDVQQIGSPAVVDMQTQQLLQLHQQHQQQQQHHQQQASNNELLRKIDELQRKLKESQQQLMQMQQTQPTSQVSKTPKPMDVSEIKTEVMPQKMIVRQHLEAKIQKEKLQQLENQKRMQRDHVAFQLAKSQGKILLRANSPATTIIDDNNRMQINNNSNQNTQQADNNNKHNVEIVWSGEPTLFLVNLQDKKDLINGNVKTSTAPSVLLPITAAEQSDMFFNKINANHQLPIAKMDVKPPPPQYEEATKQIENSKKDESQIMTDVLDILIQNGELPADSVYGSKMIGNNRLECGPGPPSIEEILIKTEPSQLGLTKPVGTTNINSDIMNNKSLDCDDSMNNFDMLFRPGMQQQTSSKNDSMLNVKYKPIAQPIAETLPSYNNVVDIKPYEELELMELISQQLDMEIGLDQCPPQYDQIGNDMKIMSMPMNNPIISSNPIPKLSRRDMNPSLQPSLNELIQQKQCENNVNSYNNNYDPCHSTPMDIEEFENSLSSFDFHTIGDMHNDGQMNTPQHPFTETMHTQPMDQHQQQQQHHIDNSHMQNGASTSHSMGHSNIMDLFNTEDFKMASDPLTWDEVDFVV